MNMNINASVLIFRDASCEKWAAQCLEYDISAQGDSLHDVVNRFERTLIGNIVLALEHDEPPLWNFLPAPHKYVEMWNNALALEQSLPITIASDELPANVLKFPDRVPRGQASLRIAA